MASLIYRKKGKHFLFTKAEREHMRENGLTTLHKLTETLRAQRVSYEKCGFYACFECRTIARKLGINPDEV